MRSVLTAGSNSLFPTLKLLVQTTALILVSMAANAGYHQHPKFDQFAAELKEEYGIGPEVARTWLAKAKKQQSVLDAIQRPAEKRLEWREYQDIFLKPKRIKAGKAFVKKYSQQLADAQAKYGVPPELIAAVIGVETFYGTRQGSYRVLDSLATLAFDYPKRPLFWRELKALFALAQEESLNLDQIKGSYAGAMGYGQFIPTSYLAYAVDGNNDGKRNLWSDPEDAIASVANYFARHGWKSGEQVIQAAKITGTNHDEVANDRLKPKHTPAKLRAYGIEPTGTVREDEPASLVRLEGKEGTEYWLAHYNYYVITRYNHSRLYAMAVHRLAQAIAE